VLKNKLQHVNSRIRCYEAALARCGFDAAGLLQLDDNQNQASAQAPDASSANGATKSEDRAQSGAPESGATSTASASVPSTETRGAGGAGAAAAGAAAAAAQADASKSSSVPPAGAADSSPVTKQPVEMEMHTDSTTGDTGALRQAPEAA
jgi:hypothetical protein